MKALQIARRRPRPGEAGSAAAAWPRKLLTGVVAALLASGAAALAYRAATGPGAAAPPVQRKPDPQVSVTVAQRTDLPIRVLAEGHVTPLNQVDLRPEVSGTVKQVHFREGEEVRAGQLLFTLDASEAVMDESSPPLIYAPTGTSVLSRIPTLRSISSSSFSMTSAGSSFASG